MRANAKKVPAPLAMRVARALPTNVNQGAIEAVGQVDEYQLQRTLGLAASRARVALDTGSTATPPPVRTAERGRTSVPA